MVESGWNEGEVAYCSICLDEMEVGRGCLRSQLGTVYHRECFEEYDGV